MKAKKILVGFLFVLISFLAHSQDTLKSNKVLYIKALPDSVFINTNNKIEYQGIILTKNEALKMMKLNMSSRIEVKMTNMFRWFAAISVIEGAISAADFGVGASQGNFNWVVGGIALIDFIVAATMHQEVNKHFDRTIKLYNTKPSIRGVNNFKPELGVASKSLGIFFRF